MRTDFSAFTGDLADYRNLGGSVNFIPLPDPTDKEATLLAGHDLCLVANSARQFVVQSHHKFIHFYNAQPDATKRVVSIIRPYWLGLPTPFRQPRFENPDQVEEFISRRLVEDLLEMAGRFRLNHDRTPLAMRKRAEASLKGHKPRPYREWLAAHYGCSTWTYPLVEALAQGRSLPEVPRELTLWGYTGTVATKAELTEVADRLASGYQPSLTADTSHGDLAKELAELRQQNRDLADKLENLSQTNTKGDKKKNHG
jgi:hypothetical protein